MPSPSIWNHLTESFNPQHIETLNSAYLELQATYQEFINSKKVKEMDQVSSEKIYNLPLTKAFPRNLRGKETDAEIGLEIECEGTHLFNAPIRWWSCHSDQSLRAVGEHSPIEYVLRKPILKSEVTSALTYLTSKLKSAGSSVQESSRTSVHVHINVQHLTIKQIYQFICLYIIFEEMLVEFSGPERKGNLFCLSAKQAEYQIQVMENAIINENFNEFFSSDLRYTSCNTASIGKFGSIEFRSMRGTVDQELIQQWVDILWLLKEKALEYEDPRAIVEDFQTSRPETFFEKIFSSRQDLKQLFQNKVNKSQLMWDGLRLMRDVAYAIEWEKSRIKKKEHTKSKPLSPSLSAESQWSISEAVPNIDMDYTYSHPEDVEELADNIYIEAYSDGTRWLVNYNNHIVENFEWAHYTGNKAWELSSRTAYKLHNNDEYAGQRRSV